MGPTEVAEVAAAPVVVAIVVAVVVEAVIMVVVVADAQYRNTCLLSSHMHTSRPRNPSRLLAAASP
jgi:hypothetical protein